MSYDDVTVLLRATAAVVWTGVLVLILRNHWTSTYLRRVLVTVCLVVLLWAVVIGGIAGAGLIPGPVARGIYTGVAVAILIVGILLLVSSEDGA